MFAIRQELDLFRVSAVEDGSPIWRLHDPVRNLFFNIDWISFEILLRWHLEKPEEIIESISQNTTLKVDLEDIEAVAQFLMDNQLCQVYDAKGTERLLKLKKAGQSSFWRWLMHHYLFFRIPLVRPDCWLTQNVNYVSFFYSKNFFYFSFFILIVGLSQCYRQWSDFVNTFVDTLSVKGMMNYAFTLIFVKILHELGHAFTAKRKRCRVPTMGIAFLVMWPVAYTDVNESWKLSNKRDRLAIGGAGVITELLIAAWATFAWGFLPAGGLKEAAFLLATTTWISTLLINISPFMRFDGYFLLSDYLEIPNLHSRSFALARWDLREKIFGLKEQVPEIFSVMRHRGLILFAWAVWIYRLILFFGIALLVYYFFFKALGVFLFIVEIGFFIMLPVWREIKEWRLRINIIKQRKRTLWSALIFFSILCICIIPWHTKVNSQAILRTAEYFPIYSPGPAQISKLSIKSGDSVVAGQALLSLESPELDYHVQRVITRKKYLNWQLEFAGLDENLRARQSITREELSGADEEHTGYLNERNRYEIKAPFSGVLVDMAIDLKEGVWINRQDRLGLLINPNRWQVETYLAENDVHRVKIGDIARFFPETVGFNPLNLRVMRIDRDVTHTLLQPILTAAQGGQWMVRERNGQMIPEKAIYKVILEVLEGQKPNVFYVMRGEVVIQGAPKSLLSDYLRTASAVLIRESGW